MLTAAPTQTKRLISLLAALLVSTSAAAQTYEPALIPPQINGAPTTMTPLNLGDDGTRNVALGFEFEYWGQRFTDAWVSSNGFVSFQSGAHLCCNGQPIEMAQRNTIYAYWSDLISYTGNPYYRREDGSILFGWYGVNEYGTNNSSTFEIGLFADGKIQLNFGNLGFSGRRDFTAGITGPTADDNIPLFYGRNAQFLQNQSGILSWIAPQPEVAAVDCNVTPMDPTCPPATVDAIPDPVAAINEAVEQSVELEPEQVEQVQEVAETALERAEEVVEAAEAVALAEEPEAATEEADAEASAAEADEAERLDPDEVAALAAVGADFEDSAQQQDGTMQEAQQAQSGIQTQVSFMQETQDASVAGAFNTQMRFDTTFGGALSIGPTISVAQSASPLDAAISAGSPMSMANTFEALGLGSPPPAVSAGNAPQSESGMSEGQGETISEMGAVPGFAAYTQASLQDRADFYAVRDIYSRRRLQDANFELYRLMQTNDARWQEMVDEQYR
jgi:hypothetical protein